LGEAILVGRRPSSSKASRAAHGAELINYNSNAVRDDVEPEEPKEDSDEEPEDCKGKGMQMKSRPLEWLDRGCEMYDA